MVGHQYVNQPIWHYINYIEKTCSPYTRVYSLRDGMKDEIYYNLRSDLQKGRIKLSWEEMIDAAQDAEWLDSLYVRESCRVGSRTPKNNRYGFVVDWEGFIEVHTDGACIGNGFPGAKAGIGIWFGYDDHKLNVSEPLDRKNKDPATNNVAEIKAVIRALEIAKQCDIERVKIFTDSMYLIDCMTDFIFKWLSNGWRKSNGEIVKHRRQYRELLRAMEGMDLKWRHVESHAKNKNHGNEMADWYAKKGAKLY